MEWSCHISKMLNEPAIAPGTGVLLMHLADSFTALIFPVSGVMPDPVKTCLTLGCTYPDYVVLHSVRVHTILFM